MGAETRPTRAAPDRVGRVRSLAQVAEVLGGQVCEVAGGECLVVDRRYAADARHGTELIGASAESMRGSSEHLPVLAGEGSGRFADADPSTVVFFDLETTGLAGGAGTYAFLVGCGAFAGDEFHTRQFFLTGYGAERPLLAAVGAWMARARLLVSFNGRTFDAPLLETRYSFHRQGVPFVAVPHLDMLHPARRLWRGDEGSSLQVLERALAGLTRHGDVPGAEIPARYVHFVRTGDGQGLLPVFEHNRLDLVTLAVLTARAAALVKRGPAAARDPRECLGLGRLYERAGRDDEAVACYVQVSAAHEGDWTDVRAEALVRLARRLSRAGRHQDAADAWRRLLADGVPSELLTREAARALAVHHEHRSRDLETARTYARRAVEAASSLSHRTAARHRLSRLNRKLGGGKEGSPLFEGRGRPKGV